DKDGLIKLISNSDMNAACLLVAAGIPTYGDKPELKNVEAAIEKLGVRESTLILAVNFAVRLMLKTKPIVCWDDLLKRLMDNIEIGAIMGEQVEAIGRETGMLAGFMSYAGLLPFLAHDLVALKKYQELEKKHGTIGKKILLELFQCEPYQVGALVIQRLGFGVSAACGAMLALGGLKAEHLSFPEEIIRWKAIVAWVEALRAGRNYPKEVELRTMFQALTPEKPGGPKNPVLSNVYIQVAKVKRNGSEWMWHLPRPDYDRTKEVMGL
ncbi:MAG: hypothetical protein KDD62_15045, partial [Bdellovibrionales bacterium]|nr:hypothetical protein [Bdellovibrionales bacterium]